YSKPAAQGTGLKARRLSTSLPDEFHVDFCELNREYKSSSFLPGRRGQILGKGATATVTLMCRKEGSKDELYAVKEYRGRDKSEKEDEYIKKVQSEYSIAKSLNHPNIVTTVRLCTSRNRWNHVMEYCSVGELYGLVEKGLFQSHYKLEDRMCFFKQLVRGVDYLHSHGIAHRDIKLENLLMDKDGRLKITDFGVSEVFSGEHPGLRAAGGQCGKNMGAVRRCAPGICGSLPYIAPEVLAKESDYDPRPLDVWSCAIVFLTMTYGGSPWQAAKPEYEHYAKYLNGWKTWLNAHPDGNITDAVDGAPKCGPIFANLPSSPLKRLMLKMLHPIPEKRINIRDVLTSACVRTVECCSPESYDDTFSLEDMRKARGASGMSVLKNHKHLPPREHKTPKALQHRFDMGHGW
ncbi:Pkinase-domain-containing protein, partial [Aulographum hederae CBS 113979]